MAETQQRGLKHWFFAEHGVERAVILCFREELFLCVDQQLVVEAFLLSNANHLQLEIPRAG